MLRVATIGAGYFSQFHLEAWSRMADVELVAVCDADLARAKEAANQLKTVSTFDDARAMIDAAKPDLIDIITPPHTHETLLLLCAEAGVDAVCQKPFATDLTTAKRLTILTESAGIRVSIHENFRFQPWYLTLHEALKAGRIGDIFQITFRLRPGDGQGELAYKDRQPYFRKMPRFLVHETAIHFVDVFRYLLGEPTSVQAHLTRLNPAIAGEDAGLIIFEFEGGIRAVFDGNRLADHVARNRRRTMGEMLLEGSAGTLTLDGDARIAFRKHGENETEEIVYDWDDIGFGGDCVYRCSRHIADHILYGSPVANSARDYLKNLEIEEAIYRSHEEGRRIALSG